MCSCITGTNTHRQRLTPASLEPADNDVDTD